MALNTLLNTLRVQRDERLFAAALCDAQGRIVQQTDRAASMPAGEKRERMKSLRATVREFNVCRWAGRILSDAGRWRLRARIEARVRRHRVT